MYRFQLIIVQFCWRGCYHSNGLRILTGKQCYCCWCAERDLALAYSDAWNIFRSSNGDSVVPPNSRPLQYVLAVISWRKWTSLFVFMALYLQFFLGGEGEEGIRKIAEGDLHLHRFGILSSLQWYLPHDGFSWNSYLSIFQKSVEHIRVSLKSDKNIGYFTWRPIYIYGDISLNEKYFRQKL